MRQLRVLLSLGVLLLLLAAPALRADSTVYLDYTGNGSGLSGSTMHYDGNAHVRFAGSYNHHAYGPGMEPVIAQNQPYSFFCMDLYQGPENIVQGPPGVDPNGTTWNPLDGEPSATVIAQYYATYTLASAASAPTPAGEDNHPMGADRAKWLRLLAQYYWNPTSLTNDLQYAAMQVAIWEIIYEGSDSELGPDESVDWDAGDSQSQFYTDNDLGIAAAANTILADLEGKIDGTPGNTSVDEHLSTYYAANPGVTPIFVAALTHPDYQDMLVLTDIFVPEPGSVALAAMGLLGLVTRRKRRS